MNGFPIFDDCTVLNDVISTQIVRYGQKKIDEANDLKDFMESSDSASSPCCTKSMPQLHHSDFELGECLGEGSFSSVFAIKSLQNKETKSKFDENKMVVKVLQSKLTQSPRMFAACAADLYKEGMIMATLNHRNIMNAQAWAPGGVSAYVSGRHDAFFLVLDRLDLTLTSQLSKWKKEARNINMSFTQRAARKEALLKERLDVVMQLSSAVKYMHSKRLLHRDMKPDNMGFQEGGVLKIFDFDISRIVPASTRGPTETFKMTKRVGSPRYMAPEVMLGEEYNLTADVYSFSLLAHQLITLEKPYDTLPRLGFDRLIAVTGVRPDLPTVWPKGLQSLLENCWSRNVSSRPEMSCVHRILQQQLPLLAATTHQQNTKGLLAPLFRSKKVVAACA
jgi:serine/threonine protein kinase